jgi:DNA-binding NarL/FixJ family response regulator
MKTGLKERERTSRRLCAVVVAEDEVSRAGLVAQLRGTGEVEVVEDFERALVAVIVVDTVDQRAAGAIREALAAGCHSVVAIATRLDDSGVVSAAEAGASAILRRSEVGIRRLAAVVRGAAEGDGALSPDLLGAMLQRVGTLQRTSDRGRGLPLSGFTAREIDVLRLLAEGYDTIEIASKLAYSERTVKNVIHGVTARFGLRNRCHAVAYAIRAGVL